MNAQQSIDAACEYLSRGHTFVKFNNSGNGGSKRFLFVDDGILYWSDGARTKSKGSSHPVSSTPSSTSCIRITTGRVGTVFATNTLAATAKDAQLISIAFEGFKNPPKPFSIYASSAYMRDEWVHSIRMLQSNMMTLTLPLQTQQMQNDFQQPNQQQQQQQESQPHQHQQVNPPQNQSPNPSQYPPHQQPNHNPSQPHQQQLQSQHQQSQQPSPFAPYNGTMRGSIVPMVQNGTNANVNANMNMNTNGNVPPSNTYHISNHFGGNQSNAPNGTTQPNSIAVSVIAPHPTTSYEVGPNGAIPLNPSSSHANNAAEPSRSKSKSKSKSSLRNMISNVFTRSKSPSRESNKNANHNNNSNHTNNPNQLRPESIRNSPSPSAFLTVPNTQIHTHHSPGPSESASLQNSRGHSRNASGGGGQHGREEHKNAANVPPFIDDSNEYYDLSLPIPIDDSGWGTYRSNRSSIDMTNRSSSPHHSPSPPLSTSRSNPSHLQIEALQSELVALNDSYMKLSRTHDGCESRAANDANILRQSHQHQLDQRQRDHDNARLTESESLVATLQRELLKYRIPAPSNANAMLDELLTFESASSSSSSSSSNLSKSDLHRIRTYIIDQDRIRALLAEEVQHHTLRCVAYETAHDDFVRRDNARGVLMQHIEDDYHASETLKSKLKLQVDSLQSNIAELLDRCETAEGDHDLMTINRTYLTEQLTRANARIEEIERKAMFGR